LAGRPPLQAIIEPGASSAASARIPTKIPMAIGSIPLFFLASSN
jgi:hypothetical protein